MIIPPYNIPYNPNPDVIPELEWPAATIEHTSDTVNQPAPYTVPYTCETHPGALAMLEEYLVMGFDHSNPTIRALYPTRTDNYNILRRIVHTNTWVVDTVSLDRTASRHWWR